MTGGVSRAGVSRVLVRAHAKLNLHLAILARETSGYHNIETVFHKIALADDVEVTLDTSGTRAVHADADVGPPSDNLAKRAADAFLAHTGWETGYTIRLTKRIPSGGGLGGGSADAAATLRALNALSPTPVAPATLLAIATPLGADVPFLTSDSAMALAWGRGERMLALDPLPERHVALVIPPFRIATAEAYGWVAASRVTAPPPHAQELHPWHLTNWPELARQRRNDFEPVVATRHPAIRGIIAAIGGEGAILAGMTGSGSTLFGIFDAHLDENRLRQATNCDVILTKTAIGVEAVR